MNRRRFLAGAGSALAIGLAGCAEDTTDPSDNESGGEGGPQTDYDKAVNTVEGTTYIDLHLRAWFDCSYHSPETVTFTIDFIAAGETIDSREWTVPFEECMNEHTKQLTVKIPDKYEDVLISITDDWSQ